MAATGTDTHYTSEESHQLLAAIFAGRESLRLEAIAKQLAAPRGLSGPDLLQEALCRTLEGRRKIPREVKPIAFVVMTMRSIASEWAKNKAEECLPSDLLRDTSPSASRIVEAKSDLQLLTERFHDDDEIIALLSALLQEQDKAHCVQHIFKDDEKAYDAARKRLRRGASALIESEPNVQKSAHPLKAVRE